MPDGKKVEARAAVAEFVATLPTKSEATRGGPAYWVRVNSEQSGLLLDDLSAMLAAGASAKLTGA